MKILLTGGAGYIGSNVVLKLIDSGHKVHIVDNLSRGDNRLISKNAAFTNCNIQDTAIITNIIKNNQFDALMHFAGFIEVEESVKYPEKYFLNNTDNAISLFETCKKNGLKNIIFSSTAAIYGNTDGEYVNENSKLNPINPYAESKLKTENFLIENKNDFNYIILRYFNVAGADPDLRSGQISKNSTHLIKILSEVITNQRKFISIYGNDYNTHDGTAVRDYIHVTDLAIIHLLATEFLIKNKNSEIFNCGYGKGLSVLDIIKTANKLYKNTVSFEYASRREGDVEKLVANVNKISKHINWQPQFDDLETIIKSSVEWEKKISEKNI